MSMILPKEAVVNQMQNRMADWLIGRMKYWGNPAWDTKADSFWEMMFDVVQTWAKWWPKEYEDMLHDRQIDLGSEKSLHELVKGPVKKTAVYPKHFFSLVKWVWPNAKMADQTFARQFAGRFPAFKNSNYT